MLVSASFMDSQQKVLDWQGWMEKKMLWVNFMQSKIIISGETARKVTKEWKPPCVVSRKGAANNSIYQFCKCQNHACVEIKC